MDVSDLRRSATGLNLDRKDLAKDPINQFEDWFNYACDTVPLDPNAVTLSTVDSENRPSSRTVLLKSFDRNGFLFYTNHNSNKANHIDNNPNVALLFFWANVSRQIRIQGKTARISPEDTLKYFSSRPRGSQVGAWASPQSKIIPSRSSLERQFKEIEEKFHKKNIPLPDFWGGYRVVPEVIEFWQGRKNRLHDRFRYIKKEDNNWLIERLAP
ncbi:MAG: pyridoxamine 5'-phosphate oxidase [Gammaproteobacteria bacterium]|nr:pyridoxamine 5'-phosphate oxidase [Gammaproteobacteria bacterium]|tara:strand:+ start:2399 stop:3037 length:639 start_codon:yes stop_codon:yes gene_type:complete